MVKRSLCTLPRLLLPLTGCLSTPSGYFICHHTSSHQCTKHSVTAANQYITIHGTKRIMMDEKKLIRVDEEPHVTMDEKSISQITMDEKNQNTLSEKTPLLTMDEKKGMLPPCLHVRVVVEAHTQLQQHPTPQRPTQKANSRNQSGHTQVFCTASYSS